MNPSPLLIATDEAGYGPRLGPLVIASTIWRLPADMPNTSVSTLESLYAPFYLPAQLDGVPEIRVGDSKTLFKSRHPNGLFGLEAVVLAACQWAWSKPIDTLDKLVHCVAGEDLESLRQQPWFGENALAVPFPNSIPSGISRDRIASELRSLWQTTGVELVGLSARVVDAARFNAYCQKGCNKADLLGEATAGLVAKELARYPTEPAHVFCDRHGGRKYYGGLLQQVMPEAFLVVQSESATVSQYQLRDSKRTVQWRFSVKGDSFAPVAMASILAKYLRERMMGLFNAYWKTHHHTSLRPTAGYPQDATRFLGDIQTSIAERGIRPEQLIRDR